MQLDEADAVSALLLRAFEEHLRAFPPSVAVAYGRELRDVRGRLGTCTVLVAERADSLIGSVTLVRDAAHDGHPWPTGGAVLRLLAVEPAARRTGVGRLLLQGCLDSARRSEVSYLGLHTAPSMRPAQALYEDVGFVRTPEHDFDPAAHYGGERGQSEATWGLGYVLSLRP